MKTLLPQESGYKVEGAARWWSTCLPPEALGLIPAVHKIQHNKGKYKNKSKRILLITTLCFFKAPVKLGINACVHNVRFCVCVCGHVCMHTCLHTYIYTDKYKYNWIILMDVIKNPGETSELEQLLLEKEDEANVEEQNHFLSYK